jgi:hypothetical protein
MARSRLFKLNADAFDGEKKLGAQPALIVEAMGQLGPATVKQIADAIKDRLQTRQDPERVVNFYMSTWKKAGKVTVEGEVESPVSDGNSENEADSGDNAGTPAGFNYATSSLREAIAKVLEEKGPRSTQDLGIELQVLGRTTTVKTIADALRKMEKAGQVTKDEGIYALATEDEEAEHVHA